MIKTLGIISGGICIIILFFNFLLYFLQDIYFKTNNKNIKKSINSALPILSKYNKCSIFICFIFFLIHISCFFNSIKHFNLNALILFFLGIKYHIILSLILRLQLFHHIILLYHYIYHLNLYHQN